MLRHDLRPAEGAKTPKIRRGRGIAAGKGKTAGRGTKGQKAREQVWQGFEGGQTPMHRRLPQKKGFRNPNHKEFAVVNLDTLSERFQEGETVDPESLKAKGLVSKPLDGIKILGRGEISKKLTVSAHYFSKTAEEKLRAGGCEVTKL
ncbi:MAG: 50S ribosomal protein L15 [Fimbriimonadia bacterium]|jgi:large subunit ribosomal protein L15